MNEAEEVVKDILLAAQLEDTSILQKLLKVDFNSQSEDKRKTLLNLFKQQTNLFLLVCGNGNKDAFRFLLTINELKQSLLNETDNEGYNVIHASVISGDCDLLQEVLNTANTKSLINEQDMKLHYSPLHHAVQLGNKEIVTALLRSGADVEIYTKQGQTAIHLAVLSQNFASLQCIIQHLQSTHAENAKKIINTKDTRGNTALHLAMRLKKDENMAKYLISVGANPTLKNHRNLTPFDIQMRRKSKSKWMWIFILLFVFSVFVIGRLLRTYVFPYERFQLG